MVRRDRLRDGWEGLGGEGGPGGPRRAPRAAGASPPRVLQPRPGSSSSPNPGAEGARPVSPRSPPSRRPPPRGFAPAGGHGRRCRGGRAAPPTARPLSQPPSLSRGGVAGRGGLSPVRPGRVAPSGAGGVSPVTRGGPPSLSLSRGEGGGPKASARGRRRCRLPTRPVLKHGPRSLTRARVGGSHESRRGAMKVKAGGPPAAPRWDPEASPVRRGRTTGPSRPPRRGGGARAHVLGPERW